MGKKPYFDPKEAALKQKAEMKEIIKKLEKGVEDVFTSENFKNFLNTMARFPHYSYNNSILIMLQKPDATLVQSYTGWKKMGRYVKKNEKGIRIIAPAPFKYEKEVEKTDDNSMVINQDGDLVREKETITIKLMAYKPVSTFDEQMQELTKEKPFDFFVSEFGEFEEIDDNQHGFTLMQRINMYYSQLIKNADKDKANTQNIDNSKNELEL